jgi:uncharacterized membrane protein
MMIAGTKLKLAPKLLVGALLLGLSLYFIFINAHFFRFTPEELGKYLDLKWLLILHISAGALALLSGPFQFWHELRTRYRKLHRRLGYVYVSAVAVSAPCAAYLSTTTAYQVGWAYAFSLQVWVSVWLVCTFLAFRYARQKKFRLHEEWMVRSYLATLAFVISALILKIPFVAARGTFAEVSPGLFWTGWSVPFFIYDMLLSFRRKQ